MDRMAAAFGEAEFVPHDGDWTPEQENQAVTAYKALFLGTRADPLEGCSMLKELAQFSAVSLRQMDPDASLESALAPFLALAMLIGLYTDGST